MPPMQHVAGIELELRGLPDMFAGQVRSGMHEGQDVLQLITKPNAPED